MQDHNWNGDNEDKASMEDHIDCKMLDICRIDSMQKWVLKNIYRTEKDNGMKEL